MQKATEVFPQWPGGQPSGVTYLNLKKERLQMSDTTI